MSRGGEVTLPEAQRPDTQSQGRASSSEADVTFGEPSLQPPSRTVDNEGKANEATEAAKQIYEDLSAQLDAMPPSPLCLEDLPQKQADVVRTFMKHGIEPPSYAELMGPTSIASLDGFRGEPFIDVPNWEIDLLDELLGDFGPRKPEIEKKMPQDKKTVPKSGEGQGRTEVGSQTAAKSSSDQTVQCHGRAGQRTQESAIVQGVHRASQAVSQQRQTQTSNTGAATSAQIPRIIKSAIDPSTTSRPETRALPKQQGKRHCDSSPDSDDTAETGPPLKRHQHKRVSLRESPCPSISSRSSVTQQPARAPLHLPHARAPLLPHNGVDLGMKGQKQGNAIPIQLGKRRREGAPGLEGFVDVDLAQPLKRQHKETAETSSIASLRSTANLGVRPMIQGTQHPQYTKSPLGPQQLPRSLDQPTRLTAPQRQSLRPAYGGHPMPARQEPSLMSHIPAVKPFPASAQHSSRCDPRHGNQPSPTQVPLQNQTQTPRTRGRLEQYEMPSQRPAAWPNADLYRIEIDGKRIQLPRPPAWMDEEVATWKAQKSNLPQQLLPQQPNGGPPAHMKQFFPSGAPPQRPVPGSANGRGVLLADGPSSNGGQPSGSQPRPKYRAAPYEGSGQQKAPLGMDGPDGLPGTYIIGYEYGNRKDVEMRQMMTSQQLGLSCQSPTKQGSKVQQEAPWLNGGPVLANLQGQFDFNGGQEVTRGGQVATSVYPNHSAATTPCQLTDITNGYNEQSRVGERGSVLPAQPWPNDLDDFSNIPLLPMQEFHPFPRANNRVPSPMQTNVIPQPRLDHFSQRPISQPPPPYQAGLQQSLSNRGPSHPRQMAAPPQPPLDTMARDQWEILEAQNAHAPVKVTNSSYRAVQLRAAAASGRKRDFESTIADTATEVDKLPSPKKLRVGYGSTQAAPSKSSSNGNTEHRLPSSASGRSLSGPSQPHPRIPYSQRAPAGSPASFLDVTPAPHTHPSMSTPETTRPVNDLQGGHGTMEAPIEIDDDIPKKPQAAPDATISAASLESKSAESANADQGSIDPGSGSWNDVKPWGNDDELDDYLAKEMADFPDDEESHEDPPDGQTHETTTVSAAAADPIPEPIFSSFRDQRPKTSADELSVNQAIQHTYNDLGNKLGWEAVNAAFAEKVRVATRESYGHQYNTLQARYVDQLVGKNFLATTKRKSKKQKKAERDVGFLYEVEGPWKTGFDDWKATNAPSSPNKA